MTNYQIFVTPLKASGVYGSEIDVSDSVDSMNIGELTRGMDLTDYDLGIYAYNDVTLVFDASDGTLNDQSDSRSIFPFSRDLAKVRIVFLRDGVSFTTFQGLINEDASSTDADQETVTLTVMGYDSIFAKSLVTLGAVPDGATFQQAFIAILNSAIGGVVGVNALNINPVYNGTVDIGSAFDNLSAKDALDKLLLPANSILTIDVNNNVCVKSRAPSANPALYLFGKGDLLGRENINLLANLNSGLQRTFNLVRVTGAGVSVETTGDTTNGNAAILNVPANAQLTPGQAVAGTGIPNGATIFSIVGTTVTLSSSAVTAGAAGVVLKITSPAVIGLAQDAPSIAHFKLRLKELTVDFVTQRSTLDAIAAALLLEFAYPKLEMEITVSTKLLQAQTPPTDLLDLVSVNFPLSVRPQPNSRLPIAGITVAGDPTAPWPYVEGAVVIDRAVAWKVIEIRESPKDFTSVLKLRVKGSGLTDGFFGFLETEGLSYIDTELGGDIEI